MTSGCIELTWTMNFTKFVKLPLSKSTQWVDMIECILSFVIIDYNNAISIFEALIAFSYIFCFFLFFPFLPQCCFCLTFCFSFYSFP
ncbi:unnamed protein product [Blepharisma stoltei]|uniref:Uncharacterized protein n=1 Tax=Blepharisma stoltei TaxID=1481888 RepID=A0AAU9IU03_9CILI|nr:unnamed protein product [Blepharisma stoltei]